MATHCTQLLDDIFDISKGTLWKIHEKLWKNVIPNYDPDSTRDMHPGLSLWNSDFPDDIPMLLGTSNNARGGFEVRGVIEGSNKTTYFPILYPISDEDIPPYAQINGNDFSPDDINYKKGSGNIMRNNYKERLDDEEMFYLDEYLRAQGVMDV